MTLEDLIKKINESAEELDFSSTRVYIENNIEMLKERKFLLNSNAREILKFVLERMESGYQPISRAELAAINTINMYAETFNLSGIKLTVKSNPQLFLRDDVTDYLNQNARVILEGLKVIEKK